MITPLGGKIGPALRVAPEKNAILRCSSFIWSKNLSSHALPGNFSGATAQPG